MVFSSFTFLSLFLPVVLTLYYLLPSIKQKNLFLLASSLFFYGAGQPLALVYMLVLIAIVYSSALLLKELPIGFTRKALFIITLLFVFGGLFFFKYINFFVSIINSDILLHSIILPIGISFYTFQIASYLIDVYKGTLPQKNIFNLALYISMFPQLVAGPIVKYETISHQLTKREITLSNAYMGFKRFLIGLSKKIIIADTLAVSADRIFDAQIQSLSPSILWCGVLLYALQIYFDFSGYSDMAIGLGRMLGFKFLENFNYPYVSKSITEFWRRWHISLSSWFKEYVYIPLGGSRECLFKTIRNLLIVFLLTGIWHGAVYTFIIWGLWYGCFLVCEKVLKHIFKDVRVFKSKIMVPFYYAYTFFVILIGWVFFRSDTLTNAWLYIKGLFGMLNFSQSCGLNFYIANSGLAIMAIAMILSVGVGKKVIIYLENTKYSFVVDLFLILLLFLSVILLTIRSYNPFIYFRF